MKERTKLGRPHAAEPMVHTGVLLPAALLQRLKPDGASSGRGLSAEIRYRLQASYEQEESDPDTRRLIECTEALSESIARDLGVPWHKSAFGRAAMKAGFTVLIAEYDSEDEKVPDAQWSGYPDEAPPDVVGQTHARLVLRACPRTQR